MGSVASVDAPHRGKSAFKKVVHDMLVKKTLTLAATVAAFALTLSGCGGSAAPATSDASKPASNAASTPAADYGLVTAGTLTVCSDIPYKPFELIIACLFRLQ